MNAIVLPAAADGSIPVDDGGYEALWDWRRQIAALYADVRSEPDPHRAWIEWRRRRDALFAGHSQSPIEARPRRDFRGLPFFPYDAALRFHVTLTPFEAAKFALPAGGDGEIGVQPFARTRGLDQALGGELTLYWLTGYGGGVFLPFADATSGAETYGAGRYLLDTIKGADLGSTPAGDLILDFNFAYNPSCSYSPRYVCPLAPAANRLDVPVLGGEQTPDPSPT